MTEVVNGRTSCAAERQAPAAVSGETAAALRSQSSVSSSFSLTSLSSDKSGKQSSSVSSPVRGDSVKGSDDFDAASTVPGDMECAYCLQPYRNPRLLNCLHSFCEDCIVAMLEGRKDRETAIDRLDQELQPGDKTDAKPPPGVVRCPVCRQDSNIGNDLRWVHTLTPDFVTINLQDMNAMELLQLTCESCKAKEKAVARCIDCANFLCPNCVQAHQFMRCFENHKVLGFDEIKNSDDTMLIHKPVNCLSHPSEGMRYFCSTCQIPVCNECAMVNHKPPDHDHEKVTPLLDDKIRAELEDSVKKGLDKVRCCDSANRELEDSLKRLQAHVDDARHSIEEFASQTIDFIENYKKKLIEELEGLHSNCETRILANFQTIGNTSEKINDACKFTKRLLRYGNTMEILYSKKVVSSQLFQLVHSVSNMKVPVRIAFVGNMIQLQHAICCNFGRFLVDNDNSETEGMTVNSWMPMPDMSDRSVQFCAPDFTDDVGKKEFFMGSDKKLISFGASGSTDGYVTAAGVGSVPHGDSHHSLIMPPSTLSSSATASVSNVSTASTNEESCQNFITANLLELARMGTAAALQLDVHGGDCDVMHSNGSSISPLDASSRPMSAIPMAMERYAAENANNGHGIFQNWAFMNKDHSGKAPMASNYGGCLHPPPSQQQSFCPANGPSTLPVAALMASSHNVSPPQLDTMMSNMNFRCLTSPISNLSSTSSCALSPCVLNPAVRHGKMSSMQIRFKFGSLGANKGQFNSPHGFCLSTSEDIVVADTNNHRIQVFDKNGEYKYQFGIPGKEEGQLWYPRKVAVMKHSGNFIVCDRGNERSRMQIFTSIGHFQKKIVIRYIDIVAGLAVDAQGFIITVDSVSPTIFCISECGELVRWFDCSQHMREPSDLAVSDHEYYVCDFKGHCVCVFNEAGIFLRRIGCEALTTFPNGIDISDAGDVLIGDSHGNRFHVAAFKKNGDLLSEFECPYVKVSRCCGLRITSEGYIITLAKNNHHLLVLNTLYVSSKSVVGPGNGGCLTIG